MEIPLAISPPLQALPDAANDSVQICDGIGGYFYSKKQVYPAGRAFYRRVKNAVRNRSESCDSVEATEQERIEIKRQEEKILKKYRRSIRNKNFLELTMYEQLGLADVGFDATVEEIRKAYHRVLIEHHPDKTGKADNDPNYLAIQTAFTTLTDPAKKRSYDSLCDFDEWIPLGTEKISQNEQEGIGKDFYELYGPVFERNARFSKMQPVPLLGDDNLDLDKVYDFYDFWLQFDSWREFTHDAEHDVESAEHRDHKRWMAKKNDVVAKKKKKKEYARLATLVDRAMANDPRIRRSKQAEKDKKEREKREKEESAQRIIQEKLRLEQEAERMRQEQEEKDKNERREAKLIKEKQKKLFRKIKKAFRELMDAAREENVNGALSVFQTEDICDSIEMEELKQIVERLGSTPERLVASEVPSLAALLP